MKIMICGAGTMGSGIAQVMAEAGHQVILRDISREFVDRGLKIIEKNLDKKLQKGKITADAKANVLSQIEGTISLDLAQDIHLILEAIVEKMEPKKELFQKLDEICPENVIFSSNTSALSISELGSVTKRPDKFIGMHFFNPAPIMNLVEVIKGVGTSEETYNFVKNFTESLGKTPVTVEEAPGFVVNRILIPMINEAAYILMEGIATAEDIDTAMKLGANHPIGPLALGDLVGLDVCLSIMETLYEETGDNKYRPCPLLKKMVRAGYLGRKTKKGFFDYK
ncbi:MAG: 3-hydroxybutyryl-CoA dehydrogenase [Clostridia bacterium]|jgi:3-hydroxybutyryl-CoA dehydrogenase|nr:3-hydroxybutyryl-CoA dehydrogenase [Clostridia bacterium]MDN5321693.1 3-hydroxybutyryl-CoA dehydrogenase [Clostridia bacterium]